ncbi:hypothetical protein PVAP13_1KG275205 [Panicum virgatum]|uniref:Uncharacterized protein n=1 Tax=Panicum virgatum TaxID=38727 RepID=A0A8T0XFC0_PANVG|nr:hypothetical protein PVAP13_1KG275205 [Panicum virgatum]
MTISRTSSPKVKTHPSSSWPCRCRCTPAKDAQGGCLAHCDSASQWSRGCWTRRAAAAAWECGRAAAAAAWECGRAAAKACGRRLADHCGGRQANSSIHGDLVRRITFGCGSIRLNLWLQWF